MSDLFKLLPECQPEEPRVGSSSRPPRGGAETVAVKFRSMLHVLVFIHRRKFIQKDVWKVDELVKGSVFSVCCSFVFATELKHFFFKLFIMVT